MINEKPRFVHYINYTVDISGKQIKKERIGRIHFIRIEKEKFAQ